MTYQRHASRYRGPMVRVLQEGLNETQHLETSNQLDVKGLLVHTRLIVKHLASGKETLTLAAAASLLLDVCLVYKRLDITGQTSQLLTTSKGTYIVSVIAVTTGGTEPITETTTGQ